MDSESMHYQGEYICAGHHMTLGAAMIDYYVSCLFCLFGSRILDFQELNIPVGSELCFTTFLN